jgi:hypothetical protein
LQQHSFSTAWLQFCSSLLVIAPHATTMLRPCLVPAGLAMEIATVVYPSQFSLLASLGNFITITALPCCRSARLCWSSATSSSHAASCSVPAGLAMEIATVVYPSQFLLLASLGNFSKAVGKGMGKPVFRVIQTHFAAAGNVGAVAAKEEVWEVSAQLTGYALSVLLLQALQDTGGVRKTCF